MLTLVLAVCVASCIAIRIPEIKPILGGNNATDTQFPYQASLRYSKNNTHFCGGAIISPQWVVTAAHCVADKLPDTMIILVGTIYLNSGGVSYEVAKIEYPVDYHDLEPLLHNIAVLKVKGNIELDSTKNVQSIRLGCATVPAGASLIVSGWGVIEYPSNQETNTLQYLQVTSIANDECQKRLPDLAICDEHLCTTSPPGKGTCVGDPGDPLVYDSQLVGVAAYTDCGQSNPDFYASVHAHRNWIKKESGV